METNSLVRAKQLLKKSEAMKASNPELYNKMMEERQQHTKDRENRTDK